jgi:hypothetical protein
MNLFVSLIASNGHKNVLEFFFFNTNDLSKMFFISNSSLLIK